MELSASQRDGTVLLLSFTNRFALASHSWNVTAVYAARWGYAVRFVRADAPGLAYRALRPNASQVPAAWEKVPLIGSALDERTDAGEHLFSTVVWLDDDCFINKQAVPVSEWTSLLHARRKDLLFGAERPDFDVAANRTWAPMNSGVIIIRNSWWTRTFFGSRFISLCTDEEVARSKCCWEQDCFDRLYLGNLDETAAHTHTINAASINCVWAIRSYSGTCEPWALHFMGPTKPFLAESAALWHELGGQPLTLQTVCNRTTRLRSHASCRPFV